VSQADHYNPILITVLPRERRARHPYQVAVMGWMLSMGLSQLLFGISKSSSLNGIPIEQVQVLNWYLIIAGASGLLATVIPERVIRWGWRSWVRVDFDATWLRLITESASQALLVFVWAAYFVAVTGALGFTTGLTFGSGGALWLGLAAAWRWCQIGWTIARATFLQPRDSAIVGAEIIGIGKGG
jgi:hypothetical protein